MGRPSRRFRKRRDSLSTSMICLTIVRPAGRQGGLSVAGSAAFDSVGGSGRSGSVHRYRAVWREEARPELFREPMHNLHSDSILWTSKVRQFAFEMGDRLRRSHVDDKSEVPNDGHVLGSVTLSQPRLILVEGHVEGPVEVIFNRPFDRSFDRGCGERSRRRRQ